MALRDTLRNLIGIPENDYDNDYDDEMQSGNIDQQEEEQTSMASPASDRKHNKVVNIHATTQLAVVLVKPERYEDAASIADHLNAKKDGCTESGADQQGCFQKTDRFSVRRGIRKQRTDETGGKQHLYHYPVQCGHYGGFIG